MLSQSSELLQQSNCLLSELSAYPNFVVSAADKIPLRVADRKPASSTNPADWCGYASAVAFCDQNPGFAPGFVLTNSPFSCIDLDSSDTSAEIKAGHMEIFDRFNSCTEISSSGKGAHVWIKGSVPAGVRLPAKKIEVYSNDRYIRLTGNMFRNVPIAERQELLDELYETILKEQGNGSARMPTGALDGEQTASDEAIVERASTAANGDLFKALWKGDFLSHYNSQSEADFSLINLLAFYSGNAAQIERMFKASALGERDKAHRPIRYDANGNRKDYVGKMILRSFDKKIPPADFNQAIQKLGQNMFTQQAMPVEILEKFEDEPEQTEISPKYWNLPPGLVGEIARFIWSNAPYPNQEVALAGAITFMAAIAARQFNISGTGLNQYIVLIARTGVGKEAAASGIGKLANTIRSCSPQSLDKYIGPNQASAPALKRHLAEVSPCFYFHLGEIGKAMQRWCSPRAQTVDREIVGALLDLFNKSGASDSLPAIVYADRSKNVPSVQSPCISILGDTTPDDFYAAVNESDVASGLLPRFTIIESKSPKSKRNENRAEPSNALLRQLLRLIETIKSLEGTKQVVNIQMTDDAKSECDKYDDNQSTFMASQNDGLIADLANRSHLRVLRLAGLLAVGCVNWEEQTFSVPTKVLVTIEHAKWAIDLIERSNQLITHRFENGEVGEKSDADQQRKIIESTLYKFCKAPYKESWLSAYSISKEMHERREITFRYIQTNTHRNKYFGRCEYGRTASGILQTLEAGEFIKSLEITSRSNNGSISRRYQILNFKGLYRG